MFFLYIFSILSLKFYIGHSSCDVFNVVTSPENEQRLLFQDLTDEITKDYSWGVWTKYMPIYEPIEDFAQKIKLMHVLSESFDERNNLVYFIVLDREELVMYHKLFIYTNNYVEIREFQVNQDLIQDNWVFFYFCYSQTSQIYSIFLYVNGKKDNVQMNQGGPFQIENQGLKIYKLGGFQTIRYQNTQLEESLISLSPFSGEISDMDLRIGTSYFYNDIPTFLLNIYDANCVISLCKKEILNGLIMQKQYLGDFDKLQLAYIDKKFMIYGWVKLNELEQMSTVKSVLMRASLRKTYFDDLYQGDKAIYWEYLQSNQNNEQNGITVTTYHNDPTKPLSQYKTLDIDSWVLQGSQYQSAITFWHWFVYQEGVNDNNNIKLSIYFGSSKKTQIYQMRQIHFEKSSLYFTIGGDKFNKNFRGEIRNLTFYYCYTQDTPKTKICHYSCKSCFGPEETQCIECDETDAQKRTLNQGSCKCQSGYVDNKEKGCQPVSQLVTVEIQEAQDIDDSNCKLGEFLVLLYEKAYCLACPGQYTSSSLNCVECIADPKRWYLNPTCKSDYFQPLQDNTDYVYLETLRNEIDYQYYLINQFNLSETTGNFNFIQNYQLNILSRFACKTCYSVINGECINVNKDCITCDTSANCLKCQTNYTLFDGQCYECPYYCPNCKKNNTGLYCLSCISGYFYNSTSQQCQQCGQFCSVCIENEILPYLQCVRCIDDKKYFISADRLMCRLKNFEHCEIQAEEYIQNDNLNFSIKDRNLPYGSTLDIVANYSTLSTFPVCLLCEDQYVNKLTLYSSNECVHASDTSKLPGLRDELKQLVLDSQNHSYQLSFSNWASSTTNYTVIYGKPTKLLITNNSDSSQQIYYNFSSVVVSTNFINDDPSLKCKDPNCIDCIKNYLWSSEFCIRCQNGYYSSAFTGLCYVCSEECQECLHSHQVYQDSWKWQIIPYYQYRSNIFFGLHYYNYYCVSTDNEKYEQVCTKCKGKDALHDGKCYKYCNCDECIFQNGQNKCLRCKDSKTYIDGQCVKCPNYCDVCKQLKNSEITQINPYFDPIDPTLYRYAKACLKKQSNPPEKGFIYHDSSLGLEVNCINEEKQPCYKYAEKTVNLYCSQESFDLDYGLITNDNDKLLFLDQNILLKQIFSQSTQSHFSIQENDFLIELFNEKSVKLMRYILKMKPNTGECRIQQNTFVYSKLRKNVFMLQSLELVLESTLDLPIYFGNNVTFQQFTSITFKNILLDSLSGISRIYFQNNQDVALTLNQLVVSNCNNLQLQFIVENPKSIVLQQVTLKNTELINADGFINYYFTKPKLDKQLIITINNLVIKDSKIINSHFLIQNLDTNYGNQKLIINGFKSLNNEVANSQMIYTDLKNQIRQSEIVVQDFLSDGDKLTKSSFFVLHGALSILFNRTTIQNGNYYQEAILFKLPLFTIQNFNILDNYFHSSDNRVLTNILDSLYADNIKENTVIMNSLQFSGNFYVGNNVFMELMSSDNFINLRVEIDQLTLASNQFEFSGKIRSPIISSNSSIYLDVSQLLLKNTKIVRSYTLPEFSINNADMVKVVNFQVTSNKAFLFQPIHSQSNCVGSNLDYGYGSIFQFYNIKTINFEQAVLQNLISINSPFFIIKSLERTNFRIQESIHITDHFYLNNSLITTSQSEQMGILSIISEQEQSIKMNKITAQNNMLHCYENDLLSRQTSTILIVNPYSNVILGNSIFSENIVTESFGSNLVIMSKSLLIQNTQFSDQNVLKYQNLKDRLVWGYSADEQIYFENLKNEFPIKSKGGNAFLSAEEIQLVNISTKNSMALQGGAFYLFTVSDGVVNITNSSFIQSQSNLLVQDKSQGGTLYVDASQSTLQFWLSNCVISGSQSRREGGVLFIEPSRDSNQIIIESNFVTEIYSLYHAFLKLPIQFTSKTLILNIQISNLSVSNSDSGYYQFYGQVLQLTKNEIQDQGRNSLISIEGGSIYMEDVYFSNIDQFGIINIQNSQYVSMINVGIQYIKLINDNLILINLNKKYQSSIKFTNVKLESIKQFQSYTSKPTSPSSTLNEYIYKCLKNLIAPNKISEFYNSKYLEFYSNNNIYNIFASNQIPKFIIGIDQVSQNHKLYFYLLKLNSILCQNCSEGVFKITNIDGAQNQTLIQFKSISVSDNLCGELGCLFLSRSDKSQLNLFSSNNNHRQLADASQLSELMVLDIKIEDSKFDNNQGLFGGAMLISGVSTNINNCQFTNNYANNTGGSIYFDYKTNSELLIFNSLFADNTANIGGAVFLGNYSINSPSVQNNAFFNNKAFLFGENQADQPVRLALQIGEKVLETTNVISDKNNITDIVKIDSYQIGKNNYEYIMIPSGQKIIEYQIFDETQQQFIPYNFTFRILAINKENGPVKVLDGSKCTIQGREVLNEIYGEFYSNYTNLPEISFNSTSQDYNLDSMIVTFQPDLNTFGFLQLEIMCNSVKIPQFSKDPPYKFQNFFTNYRLRINIQTFQCQRGEYKTDDGKCKLCDSSSDQYTVIAGERCQIKDQIKMEQVSPARIMLRPEYWRPSESNEKIEYCLNQPENCVGGWDPGDGLCDLAHIGALCEQCDIYNIRGQGSFSVSTQYKCGSCSNIGDNTIKIVLISVWTMISIFLSVKGTIQGVEKMVAQSKLLKLKQLQFDQKAGHGGVLIKVLTNYLQIIGAVALFQLKLPSALQSTVRSVGNPVEAMSYSLDCFLANITDINIIYFRMVWALIMPILYIFTFLLIYILAVLLNMTQSNRSAITTTAIYLFTYLQPTLLGGFISLLSFRNISGIYWVQGNVAYKYITQQHIKWVTGFVLPSSLILGLFIPLYMFLGLYRQRFKLEDENTRKNWGYLYNEYQHNAYFWEIIKIFQKGFMIVFLTFYEDQIIIKGALIFMIVFIYQIFTKKFKPYKLRQLNLLDEALTLVCGASIVMGMTIYQANTSDNQEIIWPFYILLIAINGIFIFILIWEILWAQLEDHQDNLDKIRDKINEKFPGLKKKNVFFYRLLTNRAQQQLKIKKRFQKIKAYLFNIVRQYPGFYNQPIQVSQFKGEEKLSSQSDAMLYNDFPGYPKTFNKIYPAMPQSYHSQTSLKQSEDFQQKDH
ncbi:unnamed protein product (macronuclear) [Paramecium tetraurelia]|uniref:Laminin EGF-like domain-containing protein n=1 Tax=Paramecium tetraurelia TaxID=5888 RepID=A0DMT7_PARTE|nr:uncharacterized protein GSPATT00018558001 [Paramecium tetraurelia]CAK84354.1 unnamed protein product [Paramecium tetraurelia]|eukprot:XP_001451751.1 hypothetical protein (macronuclear) [Paramecium tetraurelia strain d4-2]